jgi:RNA polymerase sigma factor (sigma-70 family)
LTLRCTGLYILKRANCDSGYLFMNDLVEKAISGDKQAEKELFERLLVRFRLFAKRHIWEDDVDDIAQEACLTILQKYKEQNYEKSFEAWAHGVLKMKIGNYLQHQSTRKKNISGAAIDNVEKQALESYDESKLDLISQLIGCLRKINRKYPRYVRVLNLVHHGYSTEEICSKLNVKPNYFYVILSRGRKMLKECIEKGGS